MSVRIDKWLWAARFYKTRSLASAAVNAGHVRLNHERVKAAKIVKVGDLISVTKDAFSTCAYIMELSDKRQSAPLAQKLYQETQESIAKREATSLALKANRPAAPSKRPEKHARRQLIAIKHQQNP